MSPYLRRMAFLAFVTLAGSASAAEARVMTRLRSRCRQAGRAERLEALVGQDEFLMAELFRLRPAALAERDDELTSVQLVPS